ncbi:MAG: HAD family hydrolase, partial [Victivallaceae bacterium]|nr:HAD family hydrolase [Victivallaceae bacterium]
TDLDGTLLNSAKELPADFFHAVDVLRKHEIRFVIASGRQYYNLLTLFGDIQDTLTFICENGAIVFDGRENIYCDEIPGEALMAPLMAIRLIPTAHPIFCGVKSAYTQSTDPEFLRNARMYYERCEVVPDIMAAAKQDRICKIAVFDPDAEANCWPVLKHFLGEYAVTLAGRNWLDFMGPSINKGVAIRFIQKRFGISARESMAFGDYLNDVELMRDCHYSYAMANAHSRLREVCNFTTEPISKVLAFFC